MSQHSSQTGIGFRRGLSASLVDQALLSLVNLAVGMVFIRFSSKVEYVIYAQITALVLLTTSVQSSLINSPALTLLPRARLHIRNRLAASLFALQAVLSIVFATLFGILTLVSPAIVSLGFAGAGLAGAFALVVWTAWLRDFVRYQLFVQLRAGACLKLDVLYTLLCTAGLLLLIIKQAVAAHWVLFMMGLAGAITTLPWLFKTDIEFHFNGSEIRNALRDVVALARWSVAGGLVSWVFGNGYVLIAAQVAGADATAEIVAARLFVAPLGMAYLAWANVFRPRASHWIAEGRTGMVSRVSNAAVAGITAGVALYVVTLLFVYPFLETHLLGAKYRGLFADILWWGGFFLASGVANIGTGVLVALGKFNNTFFAAAAGCLVSVPLMFLLGGSLGKHGILLGLTIGEVVTALWLYIAMRNGLLRSNATQGVA